MFRDYIKNISLVRKILDTNRYKLFRHWLTLYFSHRGHFTLTRFCRLPGQYEVLSTLITNYFLGNGKMDIRIVCVACSNGSEPYTIASVLTSKRPEIDYSIDAYDIDDEMLSIAINRTYSRDEVYANKNITGDFISNTFDKINDAYVVKDALYKKIKFHKKNAMDPGLRHDIKTCDILFVQNLFNNLKPRLAKKAFLNVIELLNEDGFLFVDGMDLGMKARLTKRKKLIPIQKNIEENYELAKTYVNAWPYWYSGLEPLDKSRKDWARRYSTIYKNGNIDETLADRDLFD